MSVAFQHRGRGNVRRRIRAADRELAALRLRRAGHDYKDIAHRLGISESGAYRAVKRGLARLDDEVKEEAELLRALEYARLEAALVKTHEIETELETLYRKVHVHVVSKRRVRKGHRIVTIEVLNHDAMRQCLAILERRRRLTATRITLSDLRIRLMGLARVSPPAENPMASQQILVEVREEYERADRAASAMAQTEPGRNGPGNTSTSRTPVS